MLERQGLLLCGWGQEEVGGAARVVRDDASGERVGFVRRAAPGPRWLRWLLPSVLEVYETEDASHLCTIHGPGWRRRLWRVLDADGRYVGAIDGGVLRDADGRRLALVYRSAGGGARYIGPDGAELAAFTPATRGILLTFTPAIEGDPFARMTILAAALVQDE
ncbi:MAG: hypothetical protein IT429_09165 [Gemmataceae bacterium]|nr:hypothetical protein [Gemmataceae bacterium]